jgi:hypothetical protein
MNATAQLDTWDPLSTNRPQLTLTDEDTGSPVTTATVTVTVRRDNGTDAGEALLAPLHVPLTLSHTTGGVYRASVSPADGQSAGITVPPRGRLILDYTATVSGTVLAVRQLVTVDRTRDP